MNLFVHLITWMLLFSVSTHLSAQDPYFSQFFANRVYLNPAYAGFDPGVTLTLNYRDQWFGVPDASSTPFQAGYRTYNATLNYQLPCFDRFENNAFGMALSFFQDEAGSAPLTTTGAAFAGSLGLRLAGANASRTWLERILGMHSNRSALKRLDLRAGFQIGVAERKLQSDFLIYSYQLDPVVGLGGALPSSLMLRSNRYFNYNGGILIRGLLQPSKHRENLFTLGFSLNNISEPNVSLRDVASQVYLPMRSTLYLSTTHRIERFAGPSKPWYISPQFRWDRQLDGQLNLQTVGFYGFSRAYIGGAFLQYNFPHSPTLNTSQGAVSPLGTRNTTTLILHSSVDLQMLVDYRAKNHRERSGLVLGFTYDVPLTGVGADAATGVLEINLRMNFGGARPRGRNRCLDLSPMEMYKGQCPWRY